MEVVSRCDGCRYQTMFTWRPDLRDGRVHVLVPRLLEPFVPEIQVPQDGDDRDKRDPDDIGLPEAKREQPDLRGFMRTLSLAPADHHLPEPQRHDCP